MTPFLLPLSPADHRDLRQAARDGIGFAQQSPPVNRYGLVIMRDRAESLAGELQVSPRTGGGTQVDLRFPIAPPARPASPEGKP